MPQERIFFDTYAVADQPADATETVIAVLEGVAQRYNNTTIALHGWADLSYDPDCTLVVVAIRRGDIDGDIIGDAVGLGAAAGTFTSAMVSIDVEDDQLGLAVDATYVLTLICVDATGDTGVNLVHLGARVH